MEAGSWEYRKNGNLDKQERELGEKDIQQLHRLVEVGARDVQGLPLLPQPAPRKELRPHRWQTRSLQPLAPKPMEPGTCHTDLSVEK